MRKKALFFFSLCLQPQLCELHYLSNISTEHFLSSQLRKGKSRQIKDMFTRGWEGCTVMKDLTSLTPLYSAEITHKVLNGWSGLLKSIMFQSQILLCEFFMQLLLWKWRYVLPAAILLIITFPLPQQQMIRQVKEDLLQVQKLRLTL